MFKNMSFPSQPEQIIRLTWLDLKPFADVLLAHTLEASNLEVWLAGWSDFERLVTEIHQRLAVATAANTADADAAQRYQAFLNDIYPAAQAVDQHLKEKLLASGLEPAGFAVPLRNMRTEAAIFSQDNLPLFSEEFKLCTEYDNLSGAQTVDWEGREQTVAQLQPEYYQPDRERRQRAWQLGANRQLADRQAYNDLWQRFLKLRFRIAANAGFDDYRSFRWQQMLRFDYTPADSQRFRDAIEKVVVPAVSRLNDRRRQRLGVETLRPWDLFADPAQRPSLRPFQAIPDLEQKTAVIFRRVDPQLGEYFALMRREGLLDLDNRKGKAPGGFCTTFTLARRPFIFMNSVGLHDDVMTLLHEGGHAFHALEMAALPYVQQNRITMEFAEVASMAMEYLASPYLAEAQGGFYSVQDTARARIEHLESTLRFWPYMAVVDAFQHWVYENPDAALDPAACDATWSALYVRFMQGVDWSGLEDVRATGWQRKLHIFLDPFYYIEYGMASLGAIQVWANALENQTAAVAAYRRALALGGTATLPELYDAAGAHFSFDESMLQRAVALLEETIHQLEEV